ncbi:MAG: coagulation factor 5/8 type domain-containing protein [Candidatus Rokuibacteriota bacterium]|nr:MAG: coagulation factor 5/8 type domain-containing protein [Candidatus Rokubacteria bacterium]
MRIWPMFGKLVAAASGIALLLFHTTSGQASVITSPTGATASSTFSADYGIVHTIDESGLTVLFVSGSTNFDAYLAGNPLHTQVALNNEWFTALGTTQATVTYDLGRLSTVDRLALWNEELSGFGTGRISYSLDGETFVSLISISPVDNPADQPYGAQVFGWEAISARFFRFDISGCPQPIGDPSPFCGIGEVAFSVLAQQAEVRGPEAVPEPGTVALLALSLVGAGWIGRARRCR